MNNGSKIKISKDLEPKENIGYNQNLVLPNWYGFDLDKAQDELGDGVKYLGTFCIQGNYSPVAVFYSPNPDLSKGHKPYPFLHLDTNNQLWVGGMTKEEMEAERYQTAAHCHNCGDVIYSVNRHDYRACSCYRKLKRIFVDGGKDYLRMAFNKKSKYKIYTLDFITHELIPSNTFRELITAKRSNTKSALLIKFYDAIINKF